MTTHCFLRCLFGLALTTGVFAQEISQSPRYLSGKITMEDGTAPRGVATIQLMCQSTARSIGRTDSKGAFSINLNDQAAITITPDATENAKPSQGGAGPVGAPTNGFSTTAAAAAGAPAPQGVTSRDLLGCQLLAVLPGFRSNMVQLENRTVMDDPNVGTLVLHPVGALGTSISATSALAPKDARKAMEKARNDAKNDKLDEARKEFERAVAIYPQYADAWVDLGRVQQALNDPEGARKSFAMASQADAKLVTPYLALATLASREKKWQEVSDATDRALKLNPLDYPKAYLLNALSNFYLKKIDAAEKSARAGLEHDAEHRFPGLNELLAGILVQKQDYEGAAEQYRKFLHYSPEGADTASVRKQLAEVEKALSEAKKQ